MKQKKLIDVVSEIDSYNEGESMTHIGIKYMVSGDRMLVEGSKIFLDSLNCEPIATYELLPHRKSKLIPDDFIVITLTPPRVNIYTLEDIYDKIPTELQKQISKKHCIIELGL